MGLTDAQRETLEQIRKRTMGTTDADLARERAAQEARRPFVNPDPPPPFELDEVDEEVMERRRGGD